MKKGFTLIELLAVIVIIGIITLITVPSVLHLITNSRQTAKEKTITSIKSAMQLYMQDHSEYYPKRGRKFYLTVSQLKHEGYLDHKLVDPITEEFIANDIPLEISNVDGNYVYNFEYKTDPTLKYDSLTPYIELENGLKWENDDEISYDTPYVYKGDGQEAEVVVNKSILGYSMSGEDIIEAYVLYKTRVSGVSTALIQTIVLKEEPKICINQTHSELYNVGDTYLCNVGGEYKTFYLIATSNDDVKFIMDRNIGQPVPWNLDFNEYSGAATANEFLKAVAKDWDVDVELPDASTLALISGSGTINGATLSSFLYTNLGCLSIECNYQGIEGVETSAYWTNLNYDDKYAYAVNQEGKIVKTYRMTNYQNVGVRPVIIVSKDKVLN